MQVKLIKLQIFKDSSGSLLPISFKKDLPLSIKRLFIIFGKKNHVRSKHAHIKSKQIYITLKGKIKILVNKKKTFYLEKKNKTALFVPENNWTEIFFNKDDDQLLVLTNTEYFKNDYIRNYSKFLHHKKNY